MSDWPLAIRTLRGELTDSFDAFITELRRAAQDTPLAADRWSSAEVAHHVTLTNHYLLILVRKIAERSRARIAGGAVFPAHPPRFGAIEAIAQHERRWQHPEHMTPSPEVPLSASIEQLVHDRAACLEVLDEHPAGEATLHTVRFSVLGEARFDAYQFLAVIRWHALRHLAQVRRNRGVQDALSKG